MSVEFQDFKDKQNIRKLETKIGAPAFNFSSTITISKMAVLPMLPVQSIKNRISMCHVLLVEYIYEKFPSFFLGSRRRNIGTRTSRKEGDFLLHL